MLPNTEMTLILSVSTAWNLTVSSSEIQLTTDITTSKPNHNIVFITYYYGILLLISMFNIFGNSLVIAGLLRHRRILTPGNYFILSLAISDLALGFVYPLYNLLHAEDAELLNDVIEMSDSWNACTIIITLTLGLISVSSFNLVGITVVRFISIKESLTYHNKVTHCRAVAGVLFIWILLLGLSAAIFLRPHSQDPEFDGICRYELFLDIEHLAFTTISSFLIPISIMIPLYIYMASQAWKQARQIADLEAGSSASTPKRHLVFKHEMKMFKMAVRLLGYFTISWLPFIIYEIVFMTCDCDINRYVRATVRLLLHSNTAANVCIYAWRLKEVRQQLKKDCFNLPCCKTIKSLTKRSLHQPQISNAFNTNSNMQEVKQATYRGQINGGKNVLGNPMSCRFQNTSC